MKNTLVFDLNDNQASRQLGRLLSDLQYNGVTFTMSQDGPLVHIHIK